MIHGRDGDGYYLTKLLVRPSFLFWSSTGSESVRMSLQGLLLVRLSYCMECNVHEIQQLVGG